MGLAIGMPELLSMLRAELDDLPDQRKRGRSSLKCIFGLFYAIEVFSRPSTVNEKS